ncbi:ABC transporter permease [Paenarthrobacter sp.]|uniref:ABC transporter permease n=1 Tax=Paenarthrobacter sp. TaxID=1931993 RepID=UPI0028113EC0|nr:ABC transporter permease [Paenarthrobacter sp.]
MTTTQRPAWVVVLLREMGMKVREKTFRIGIASTLILVVLGIAALSFFSNRTENHSIAVIDDAGTSVVHQSGDLLRTLKPDSPDEVSVVRVDTAAVALDKVSDGTTDAALIPVMDNTGAALWKLVGNGSINPDLEQAVAAVVQQTATSANAARLGVNLEELGRGSELQRQLLSEKQGNDGSLFVLKFVFSFMFVSALMTYGLAIAQSVVEEKESRVVEILAAATSVKYLLVGKIGANFILGFLQVTALTTIALTGLAFVNVIPDLGRVAAASGWFIFFFVLGFFAVSCIWSALGSMATRSEDLASSAIPMQILLFGAYFLSFTAPEEILRVASFVPVFSSIAMPTRILDGGVEWWEPWAAASGVVVVGILAIRLSTNIYLRTLMRTNRRTSLKEALRNGPS